MSVFQEALRDAAVFTLMLLSPIILYIVVFCVKYFVHWIVERRRHRVY